MDEIENFIKALEFLEELQNNHSHYSEDFIVEYAFNISDEYRCNKELILKKLRAK